MDAQHHGLTTAEAQQLLVVHGTNELKGGIQTSSVTIFFSQFKNLLMLLLIAASLISLAIGDWHDAVFILIIVFLNAILGFVQEYKAENAMQSLKRMTTTKIRVIRDGVDQMLDSRFLVPGDVVRIEQGDKIPADGQLIVVRNIEINEASLTGESLPVIKDTKQNKTVFMGTIVTSGNGLVRLIATGQNTRFGQLAESLTTIQEQKTPLEKKIARLSRQLTIAALTLTFIIFLLGLLDGQPINELIFTSISLAVAAVPEGLPAVITIALAVGLQRMAKKKAILRRLGAIEALGNTSVIVTDKTGTLTENKMKVLDIWTSEGMYKTKNIAKLTKTSTVFQLLQAGVLCNNSSLVTRGAEVDVIGEQTEGSLMLLAHHISFPTREIKENAKIVEEYSFDQSKKLMSMCVLQEDKLMLYTKGAPESVLKRSTKVLKDNKIISLTYEEKDRIQKAFETFATDGLRILAVAQKPLSQKPSSRDQAETNLTFLGFVGITDPPREEIREVLKTTQRAGIKTVMVTGDNPLTARAIAHHIGLISDGEAIVTGDELQKMSDEELSLHLDKIRIFARTTPQDKLRIVKLFQKKGEIVTVTGDGINDALAIKQGNTGVAMGITGTDVAKEVADMVITDDNFASIVSAVHEGRVIFDNMMKSLTYLISTNLGEILIILYSITTNIFLSIKLPLPLLAVHILWINLVTDGLPALSLAFDRGTRETMNPRPNTQNGQLLGQRNVAFMIFRGVTISAVAFSVYVVSLNYLPLGTARLITFNTLVFLQLMTIFFVRKGQPIFSNKILLLSLFISISLQIIIMFVPPFPSIFEFQAL